MPGERRRRTHQSLISGRRRVMEWFIITLMFMPSIGGVVLFGAVTTWAMAPLLLLFLLGAALLGLRPIGEPEARLLQVPPGGVILGLFFLYGLVRAAYAPVPASAHLEMIQMGSYLLAYWAWCAIASHHHRWKILLGILLAVGSLLCWYAIIQHSHDSRMVLFRARPEMYGARASATYICPNHFAHLLEMLAPFALALLWTASAGLTLRLLAGYSLLLLVPVLLMTQSRSGVLATLAGGGLTLLLIAFRRSRKLFYALLVLLPAAALLGLLALYHVSPAARDRMEGADFHNPDKAVESRFMMWSDTRDMIKDHPLLGVGPAHFEWFYPKYQQHHLQYWFDFAHNEFLQLTADYGVVGLALLLLFLGVAAFRVLPVAIGGERDRDANMAAALAGTVAAGLVHALFDFNFHLFANNHVLALLAGTVAAGFYGGGPMEPRPLARPASLAIWIAGCVLTVALLFKTTQLFLADRWDHLAYQYRERLDLDQAIAIYDRSLRMDPARWQPYLGKGEVLAIQSFWSLDPEWRQLKADEAVQVFRAGAQRNPYHMDIQLGLARALARTGDSEAAERILLEVAEFAHHDYFYLTQVGLQLRRLGRQEKAEEIFVRARDFGYTDTVNLNIDRLRKFRGTLGP